MKIEIDPKLPPLASKPYPLLLKHHIFAKGKMENVLEARFLEFSMSPCATSVIVFPRKSKPVSLWLKQND